MRLNESLVLTTVQHEDCGNLVRYLNDPEIYQNTLTVPFPYTEQHAGDWLAHLETLRAQFGQESHWAIRHREHGLIGGIGCFFKTGPEGHLDEIGYWLAAPFRGQGWMTAIVTAFSNWLFATRPALVRLEAHTFPHNPASGRVLEKAGYVQEAYLHKRFLKAGTLLDAILWARVRP